MVYSSDAQNPNLRLVIKGRIKGIECRPSKYAYFYANAGESQQKEFQLFSLDEKISTVEATSNNPYISVLVEPVPQTKSETTHNDMIPQYKLYATLSDKATAGRINGVIQIKTDSKYTPRFDIRLNGEVRPPISVVPRTVGIFLKNDGSHAPCFFRVNSTRKNSIRILKIQASNANLKIAMSEQQPGKVFKFDINWKGGLVKNAAREYITINTSDKSYPQLKVPVIINPSHN